MIRYSELPSELRFIVLRAILNGGPLPAMECPSSLAGSPRGHSEDPGRKLTQVMFVGLLIQQHFVHAKHDLLKGDCLFKALLTCLAQTLLSNFGVWA